ncbi:hypothetical protein Q6272_31810, partial [Klebsiella pneumoniae]|uniref:hypothetical protein n=1 Tax=Klebsiella pneumoniae TaxID=573 RepID=UPI002731DDB8
KVISKYEPRLVGVKIKFEPRPDRTFMSAFNLTARVRVEGRDMPVVFESVLNPAGHITVLE